MDQSRTRLMSLATKIVTAHLRHNEVRTDAVPGLIRGVWQVLDELSREHMPSRVGAPHDGHGGGSSATMLVCRECGARMKMLKRHLITVHGLTPDAYRQKWHLPPDTPMVSADYAALRSTLAKQSGLGRRPDARPRRG